MRLKALFAIILLVAMSVSYPAAAETITYTWTPCDGGSPAVDYRMEVEIDGEAVDSFRIGNSSAEHTIEVQSAKVVAVRVAGVDSQDRQGPWSEWSEDYTADDGPPTWTTQCIPVRQ